jgi:S1-C subfamily serine protease
VTAQDVDTVRSPAGLYERATKASVEILVDDRLSGTGVFVDPIGLVMTAGHAVGRPGARIEILSPVAERCRADAVAVDLGRDLALLRLPQREGGYPAMPVADHVPPPGEEVYMLGTPVFRHAVMQRGMIARKETTFEYYSDHYVEVLHVAATIQSGTSGGPWFNRDGKLIGIQSGGMSAGGLPLGVAFVSPLRAIRALLQSQRTAATGTTGAAVEETWQQQREVLDRFPPRTEGLVVRLLTQDGPALRAGIQQWDVITRADGQRVRLPDELLRIIRRKQPGEVLSLTVLKPDGAGVQEKAVTLGKLEVGWPSPEEENEDTP